MPCAAAVAEDDGATQAYDAGEPVPAHAPTGEAPVDELPLNRYDTASCHEQMHFSISSTVFCSAFEFGPSGLIAVHGTVAVESGSVRFDSHFAVAGKDAAPAVDEAATLAYDASAGALSLQPSHLLTLLALCSPDRFASLAAPGASGEATQVYGDDSKDEKPSHSPSPARAGEFPC